MDASLSSPVAQPPFTAQVEVEQPPRPLARRSWVAFLQALLTIASAASLVVIASSIALSIGPRFAPFETYIVLSGSMEPLIHVGAVEVVRPVPPETLQIGDIITYRRIEEPDVTVTHRITQVTPSDAGTLLRTKGDVNETEDPWELQLRGTAWKHVFSVPYAGFVFVFAQTSTGRWLTLLLPAGVLAALWLRETWRGKRPPVDRRSA